MEESLLKTPEQLLEEGAPIKEFEEALLRLLEKNRIESAARHKQWMDEFDANRARRECRSISS